MIFLKRVSHHITPCSKLSWSSHLALRKGKLLAIRHCPLPHFLPLPTLPSLTPSATAIVQLFLRRVSLQPTLGPLHLLTPPTWKTLPPKRYPAHHHFVRVLLSCFIFLLILSEIILGVCLFIHLRCLFPLSEWKLHLGGGLALLTPWHTVNIDKYLLRK